MSTIPDESMIRVAFAPARALEPTDAEIARTVTAARSSRRATRLPKGSDWRRLAAPGLAALALIAGGAYAVPATRAAIDDVVGTFAGYVAGDDADAPGRPLAPDESPASSFGPGSQPRVIAEADGYKLEFLRVGDGEIDFDLGETGVGLGYSLDDLAGHAVYVLGPGAMQNADEHGHVPLFGVTAPQVRSVELTYAAGPPLRLDGIEGGFVLLADPTRDPSDVVAYDGNGQELERESLHSDHGIDIHWEDYGPPAPRVPTECQPGAVGVTPPPACPNR